MNKIRSFCLRSGFMIALIIVFSFTFFNFTIVNASEEPDVFIDLMDYNTGISGTSGVIPSTSSWIYEMRPGTGSLIFDLPEPSSVTYVDILLNVANWPYHGFSFSSNFGSLSVTYFGPHATYARVYGYTGDTKIISQFILTINNPSNDTYWSNVMSFRYYTKATLRYDIGANYTLTCGASNYTGSLPDYRQVQFTSSADDWRCFINIPSFQGYDYVDISFMCNFNTITSISLVSDLGYIPLEWSFLETDGIVDTPFSYVNLRIDLTGIDRTIPSLEIYISGACMNNELYSFALYECQGYVNVALNSTTYWYHIFKDSLAAISGSFGDDEMKEEGKAWKDKGKETGDRIDDAVSGMDSMQKPEVGSGDLTGDVSDIISVDTIEGSTVILSTFFEMPVVSEVVVIALTIALAGYVLFGKRR